MAEISAYLTTGSYPNRLRGDPSHDDLNFQVSLEIVRESEFVSDFGRVFRAIRSFLDASLKRSCESPCGRHAFCNMYGFTNLVAFSQRYSSFRDYTFSRYGSDRTVMLEIHAGIKLSDLCHIWHILLNVWHVY